MTGRARVVNASVWRSYFVLLCNEAQAQPGLSLNHQRQLLQTLGGEDKQEILSLVLQLAKPTMHREHVPLGCKRNILQIGNKQKSFSRQFSQRIQGSKFP